MLYIATVLTTISTGLDDCTTIFYQNRQSLFSIWRRRKLLIGVNSIPAMMIKRYWVVRHTLRELNQQLPVADREMNIYELHLKCKMLRELMKDDSRCKDAPRDLHLWGCERCCAVMPNISIMNEKTTTSINQLYRRLCKEQFKFEEVNRNRQSREMNGKVATWLFNDVKLSENNLFSTPGKIIDAVKDTIREYQGEAVIPSQTKRGWTRTMAEKLQWRTDIIEGMIRMEVDLEEEVGGPAPPAPAGLEAPVVPAVLVAPTAARDQREEAPGQNPPMGEDLLLIHPGGEDQLEDEMDDWLNF